MSDKIKLWFATACLLVPLIGAGQTIENVKTSFDGEKMIITYDLNYTDPNQKFRISIYSSHDNYQKPLSLLIGDFGDNVSPGKSNTVIWDAKSSLPSDFDNNITIKLKATLAGAGGGGGLVKLSMKPFDQGVYKKGTPIEVRWVGGNPADKLNIELYKDGALKQRIATAVDNNQHYTWAMPKNEKAGKQFIIRISSTTQPTDLSNSQFFDIKPRTPLIVKLLPIVAVVAVVAVVASGGGGGGGGGNTPTKDADLPAPINPK
jgi:Ser-Thr-rich glycosyl-phosphatidyl-inositol-anchored membrane family